MFDRESAKVAAQQAAQAPPQATQAPPQAAQAPPQASTPAPAPPVVMSTHVNPSNYVSSVVLISVNN